MTFQDGPNVEGLFFEINVHYEAFDGLDASDPLGVTPGKNQYAYILEYVSGNQKMKYFDVESTNGVPLLEIGTSTTATVNGVSPGTVTPPVKLILTLPSGNPAARFFFPLGFSGVGTKSVVLVFTASNTYDVGLILAKITDTSLGGAGEVVGPVVCVGTVEGSTFCLNCGPDGQVAPMEGVAIKVLEDGNAVASAVSGENGRYQVTGLGSGKFTVAIDDTNNTYAPCSMGSVDVNVSCNGSATVNFCVCPPACEQQIRVRTVCDQNGVEVPVRAWVGIGGPEISKWTNTGSDGVKCFKGPKIVPGHYTVKITAPRGYEVVGGALQEFDLAECESKELVFNVCLIPPCVQTVCISVVEAGDDGNTVPVADVNVCVKCLPIDRKCSTTGPDGKACFDLKIGHHVASIEVPEGYRLCDGDNKAQFSLKRCENKDIQFVLCKIILGPCPKKPEHWKCHPDIWPIDSMWIGADTLNKTALMNILNGKLPNGSAAPRNDVTMEMAQNLIAAKLSIAAGSDVADISPAVIASDEFFLYDYPPGSRPQGKGMELARKLKNQLHEYLQDCKYCQP